MGKRKTTSKFIEEGITIYGDRYDYSKTVYTGGNREIIITCRKHDDFTLIEATNHINQIRQGCPICAGVTTEDFIIKGRERYGDKFDYSLVNYINQNTKVNILCPVHYLFSCTPVSHLKSSSYGCPDCVIINSRQTKEKFIIRCRDRYGNRYDYSEVDYVDTITEVTIICMVHGSFTQTPHSHLSGIKKTHHACPECIENTRRMKRHDFIRKSKARYGDRFDYHLLKDINITNPVTLICKLHDHSFTTTQVYHFNSGCVSCCPLCIEENRNIRGKKYYNIPTMVYYVKLREFGVNYWKVGITTKSIHKRFGITADKYEVIWSKNFDTGKPAWMFEQYILHKYDRNRLYDRNILTSVGGWTEILGSNVASNKSELFKEHLLDMAR